MTGPPVKLDLAIPPAALPGLLKSLHLRPTRATPVTLDFPTPKPTRFEGRERGAKTASCRLTLLDGTLRCGRKREALARITLEGPADAIAALALPGTTLAAETLAAAAARLAGAPPPDPPPALPSLTPEMTVDEALATTLAHFAARLRHLAPLAAAGTGPEAVHQMRVTVRRARSALKLFRRAAGDSPLADPLRTLGHALAPAREWDVFLGGIAAAVATTAGPPAARGLVTAARKHRAAAYTALRQTLAGPDLHRLTLAMTLAALDRPWTRDAPPEPLALPLATFADAALRRQFKRLTAPGPDLAGLPEAALHDIRLEAKRMRYAAELFAALHDRKRATRFIARLTALQEQLGHLNDGVAAATQLDTIGPAGRGYGGGIARGLVAARSTGLRREIERTWRRLRAAKRFWT